MNDETIGSALTKRREILEMSRVQAAKNVGMSRTTYSSYERDEQRPSVDVFPALAAFLDITVEDFLALYGATVVAALRPSLERILAEKVTSSSELPAMEEEFLVEEGEYWLGSAAAIPLPRETAHVPEAPDVPQVPDVPEVHDVPDAPDVPEVLEVPEVPYIPHVSEAPPVPDEKNARVIPDEGEVPDILIRPDKSKQKKKKKGKKRKGKS